MPSIKCIAQRRCHALDTLGNLGNCKGVLVEDIQFCSINPLVTERLFDATDRYGCEIIAEKVDFLSRAKASENEDPNLVDKDDEVPF